MKNTLQVGAAKLGNGVAFILREWMISTQVWIPFLGGKVTRTQVASRLSHIVSRPLHLLLESAPSNMSLQLSPVVHLWFQ
jgi:hypothetical protein